jgi:hypothetical protein
MSVGKLAIVTIGVIFAGLLLAGCEGDDGPPGPPGLIGPGGPAGGDRPVPQPDDRLFALQISNGTESDYRWASGVELNFAAGTTPSGSRAVGVPLETAPVIDGLDGGTVEWGAASAVTVDLDQVAGNDNGISAASIRCGYDMNYVYLQVSWTEVAIGDFQVAADQTKSMWIRDGSNWLRSGGEDQIWFYWDGTGPDGFAGGKMQEPVAAGNFDAGQQGDVADVWVWQSTETGYSPFLRDLAVWSDAPELVYFDSGFDLAVDNVEGSSPWRMRKNSSSLGSGYPLLSFEATTYDASLGWETGATIPGYVFFEPAGSLADVQAVAIFATGTWTLEMRRLRNTGNPDDQVF